MAELAFDSFFYNGDLVLLSDALDAESDNLLLHYE